MNTNPLSFHGLLSRFWIKVTLAMGIGACLFFMVFITAITYSLQTKNFKYIGTSIGASLKGSLQVGDELELAKRLNALTSSGTVLAIVLTTPDGRTLSSGSLPEDIFKPATLQQSLIDWLNPWFNYWVVREDIDLGENRIATLNIFHDTAEVSRITLIGFSLTLAGLLIGIFFVVWRSKAITQAIGEPLKEFANIVAQSALEASKISPKTDSIASVKETNDLYDVFCERQRALESHRDEIEKQRSEKAKYQAIARTAQMFGHDAKRPFSRFDAAVSYLKDSENPGDFKKRLLKATIDIQKARRAIEGMIVDVMVLDEERVPQVSDVEPARVLEDSLQQTSAHSQISGIGISFDIKCTRMIAVEPVRIERVFVNIIANALEAMQPAGRIWFIIEDSNDPDFVRIKIGNTNSFIPESDLPWVFDSFFSRRKKTGTGLGLAISKKIVEQHGGTISCHSDIKLGTEFTIDLPSSVVKSEKQAVEIDCEDKANLIPLRNRRAILIEDDDLVVESWKSAMTGYKFECYYHPDTFLSSLSLEKDQFGDVDFIICDYYFDASGKTGEDVARAIRERSVDVPILLSSDSELVPDLKLFSGKIGKKACSPTDVMAAISSSKALNKG